MITYYKMFGEDLSVYRELPVDIDTFIGDSQYIGEFTKNGKRIYEFWRKELWRMFNPENPNKYYQVVNATAIGCGKTQISLIAFTYTLYCYMCLANPNEFFTFNKDDIIAFALVSMDNIYVDQLYACFMDIIKSSPWFKSHGVFNIKDTVKNPYYDDYPTYKPFGNIEIIRAYKEKHLFGVQLVCYNFQWLCDNYKGTDVIHLHSVCNARIRSRTTKGGKTYGRGIIDYELSNNKINIQFLDLVKGYEDVLVVNDSQWHIKPFYTFDTSKFFGIAYDGTYGHTRIFDQDFIENKNCSDMGSKYKIIEAPINFLSIAKLDPDLFLLNIAGIQLKKPEDHLTFMQAVDKLMTGDYAIMIENSNFYFAMNDNCEILTYTINTNTRNYDHTTDIFNCESNITKYIYADNWIAIPNPIK